MINTRKTVIQTIKVLLPLVAISIQSAIAQEELPHPAGTEPTAEKTPVRAVAPEIPEPANGETYRSPDEVEKAESKPAPPPQPVAQPKRPLPTIGGVSIVGLTDVEAVAVLRDQFKPDLIQKIALSDGKTLYWRRRVDLGAEIPFVQLINDAHADAHRADDIPVRFVVDLKKAKQAMTTLASRVGSKPGIAKLAVGDDGEVVFRGGEGVDMAINGSAWRVKVAIEAQPSRPSAFLVVKRSPAKNVASLKKYQHFLAEYATPFDPSVTGRTKNLKIAASHIDGTTVAPGKVFSTNQAIGPRNNDAGWQEALMFLGGRVVNARGSGICQCASTIYNAALLAALPIVERHQHSFLINYAPPSRDATIYWGHKDMRFRNDTGGTIRVQTFIEDNHFHVQLFGTKPLTKSVTLESKVLSHSKEKGTRSEAFRTIETKNGSKREKLSTDYYRPKPD